MAKVSVFNLKREKVGEIDLSDEVFGTEIKEHLFHEVVTAQLASRRAGTRAAKERSAVRGSSKKLYKQKGTGRARHGSARAPIYVGGGRAHPPKPQDWSYRPPRRVRIGALRSALSLLVKEGRLTVVDRIDLGEIKTRALASALTQLQTGKKTLVVDDKGNENLRLSIRNMKDNCFLPPEGVNVYDLLRHDHLLLSQDAVKKLEERCLERKS
ncbi:MAG TPA: 50S ribosomal protein L4 [Polyangiaceae bacterium]